MFCQLSLISKKVPMQKCAENAKSYQTLKFFSSLVSLTLEQLTAMPLFNMQNMCCFFFLSLSFFLAVIMIRILYFICIIFVKNIIIYWLISTVNHQGSYYPFFCLHPVGKTFLYPNKFCNHLKHSAK